MLNILARGIMATTMATFRKHFDDKPLRREILGKNRKRGGAPLAGRKNIYYIRVSKQDGDHFYHQADKTDRGK